MLSIIGMVVIADFVFGKLIAWYVDNHTLPGDYLKFQYIMKESNEDILLLGSSVCMNSLIPSLFEEKFNMSCFNGGANAQNLSYIDTMVDSVLTHHVPKYVILALRPYELFQDIKERYNMFRIYYKHGFTKMDQYLEHGTKMDYFLLQSSFYRLNTYGWRLLLYNFKSYNELGNKGFVAKRKLDINPILIKKEESSDGVELPMPNPDKMKSLKQITSQCKENDINVIIVIPPAYYELSSEYKQQSKVLQEYCLENDIPYFDDFYNPFFIEHPELFFDNNHLKGDGAKIYTQQLLEKLESYVKTK